jgi:phosphohistidine phosphatase
MKTLSIFRHAKAERADDYADDQDRPLTGRGEKDAAEMAGLLARLEPPVDWIVSSPSRRTRTTAELLAAELRFKGQIAWHPAIYAAQAMTLLEVLATLPSMAEHAVLVGHNPGLEELVAGLCSGAPDRLRVRLATAAVAQVELDIAYWSQTRWGCGTLQFLVRPKLLP